MRFLTLIILFPLMAEAFTLNGKVVDSETSVPLEGVRVIEMNTGVLCLTGADGTFRFDILRRKFPLKIKLARIGYLVKIQWLEADSAIVELTPSPIEMKEIVIIGEKEEKVSEILKPKSMKLEDIKSIAGVKKDIFRTLQTLPGIATTSDFAGWLFVRGGKLRENLYLLDGGELIQPYHFFGLESILNQDMVGELEFSPGGFSARYGDRLGGILEVKNREGSLYETKTKFSLDPIEAYGIFETPLGKNISIILSGRRNYIDLFLKKQYSGGNFILPFFSDVQGKLTYKIGNHVFFLSNIHSKEEANVEMNTEDYWFLMRSSSYGNLSSFFWEHSWQNKNRINMRWFDSYYDEDFYASSGGVWYQKRKVRKIGGNMDGEISTGRFIHMLFGASLIGMRYEQNSMIPENIFDFGEEGIRKNVKTYGNIFGTYGEGKLAMNEKSYVNFGGRIEWFSSTREIVGSPRFKIGYDFSNRTKAYFAWGKYFQFPSFEYIDSLKNTQAEESVHFVAGMERKLDQKMSLHIDCYSKELRRLVTFNGKFYENKGFGYSRGIEFFIRRKTEIGFEGWVSYSISKSRRKEKTDTSIVDFEADIPHVFNLVLNYRPNFKWLLGIRGRASSGNPFTPVIGWEYTGEKDRLYPIFAERNSERFPYYMRWDIRMERDFHLFGGKGVWYAEIINLLDRWNMQSYSYTDSYRQRIPFYMIPRLPVLGVEMEF